VTLPVPPSLDRLLQHTEVRAIAMRLVVAGHRAGLTVEALAAMVREEWQELAEAEERAGQAAAAGARAGRAGEPRLGPRRGDRS
jgi:hypothetical protein